MRCGFAASRKTDCAGWRRRFSRAFREKHLRPENSLAINARHRDCLRRALDSCELAHGTMEAGLAPEYMAVDLRAALRAVGEITGVENAEEILDSAFRAVLHRQMSAADIYERFVRPILFSLDPETAHHLAVGGLRARCRGCLSRFARSTPFGRRRNRKRSSASISQIPSAWRPASIRTA